MTPEDRRARRRPARGAPPPSSGEALGQSLKTAGGYGTIGLELVLGLLLALAAGHWADQRWGLEPWGKLAGAAFGLATGVRALVRVNRRAIREALAEEQRVGNPAPEIPYPEPPPEEPPAPNGSASTDEGKR